MIQRDYINQKFRIKIFTFGFVLAFGLIIFRLFEIQIVKGKYYSSLADNQHSVTRIIPAERGKIYIRDIKTGEKFVLATNKNLDMVYAVPQQIKDKKKVSEELASILNMDKEEIFSLIDNEKLYVPIKHKLNLDEVKRIEESESLPGVLLKQEQWREYPETTLASNVVGFVNNDGDGNYGVEGYFNEDLLGKAGEISLERDSTGRPIAVGDKSENPAEDGKSIVLTIDRTIQSFAEKELADTIKKFSSPAGSITVMDPNSGEILAMANYPYYDPNTFNEVEDVSFFKNQAITGSYEPGSIFKIFTEAAGLDSGKITPSMTYTDTGSYQVGSHIIKNATGKAFGVQTMTQVLEQSLNTGTCFIKDQIGNEPFYNYIVKFGFGQKTGIGLVGEAAPSLRAEGQWRDIDYATASFGQGIAVTPIQFLQAASAIANGGELVQPRIVSEFILSDGSKVKPEVKPKVRVLKKDAASQAGAMMVSVVERGHGKTAQVKGYRIAGKTGTAQVAEDGKYTDKTIGSFILFGPAEDPKFIILVRIDEPKGVQWAESTAAPAAGRLAKKILEYMEISPNLN